MMSMKFKNKNRILAILFALVMAIELIAMPLSKSVNAMDLTEEVPGSLISISVTDAEGNVFSQDNMATAETSLKLTYIFRLPIGSENADQSVAVEIPRGIVLEDASGSLMGENGTYKVVDNKLIASLANQENSNITEDSLELYAHFSEDVMDYIEEGTLNLEFEDEAESKIQIPLTKATENETETQNVEAEEAAEQTEEITVQSDDAATATASGVARDGGMSTFSAGSVEDIMFTDVEGFSANTSGIATMTYVNTINASGYEYSEIVVGASFGGDFDTSNMTIEVYEIVDNGGTSENQTADPNDYTIAGTTVTFSNTGNKQFVIKYVDISTSTSYLSSYGIDLDSGPVGSASFSVEGTEATGGAIVTYSYNRNFQPITADTEGQDPEDPDIIPNKNLHLNSILTGLSSTTAAAGQEITITYTFSLNDLLYAIDADKKMSTTLTDAEKDNYDGKLNVHAGDYYVFQVDTSKIVIGNNVSGELQIGGSEVIGYYSLDSRTGTMTFVFTREAELEPNVTDEIQIVTVTSASLTPGDEITTQINGEGDTSVVVYYPYIEISKSGERDDDNQQVIWTIVANEKNYEVKDMVIFDNRAYAAEGNGTTGFSLIGEIVSYSNNNWSFGDSDSFTVEEIDDNGDVVDTLELGTDYTIDDTVSTRRSINLIGDYATTSATIRVTITGDMTNPTNGSTAHYFMNYASASGSNITTSVAKIDVDSDSQIRSATGSAYIPNVSVAKSSTEAVPTDDGKFKVTWSIKYNQAGADIDPIYAYVTDQPMANGVTTTTNSTNYGACYINSSSNFVSYLSMESPDAADDISIENSNGDTLVKDTDYTVEVTSVSIGTPAVTQYAVKIQFLVTDKTSTDNTHINIPTTISYTQYAVYNSMPSGATGMKFNNTAVTGTGYSTSVNEILRGIEKSGSLSFAANTSGYTVNIDGAYIDFDDGYCIYDILPQGHTLVESSFSITATDSSNGGTTVGSPNVVVSGDETQDDIDNGYFELVTGEDFGTPIGNSLFNEDKDFYLIFHEGSTYTSALKYSIVYTTNFMYEAWDPGAAASEDYSASNNTTKATNSVYLYDDEISSSGSQVASASNNYTFNNASGNNYRYYNTNIVKAGGYTRSVAADDDGEGASNPTITWRVYGNIWNNSLNGATLTDTLGLGATAASGGTTDSSLTQTIDTSSIKLYVFTRGAQGNYAGTTITDDTANLPRGTIGTVNLLDYPSLGIVVDTTTNPGEVMIKFPSDYEDKLRNLGIDGIIDSIGNVNMRFVLQYETELDAIDLDHPYYSNTVQLERNTETSDKGPLTYTDKTTATVEIKEFTDGTYDNTKIGVYDGNEKLIHYTAILNKGGQSISDDGNGNNPTIHDTLYYTVNETTGEAEQQILYLMESTLKVYEAKASSSAENGYVATKLLEAGVDYNLVYNQDELDGFDIVFTNGYIPVDTPIIVEYDAAYNHVTVPTYVSNEIYFVGYETYTSGEVDVYISETTVISGWARQMVDLNVLKVDESGNKMAGVKFALVDKNGVYRIESQTTDAEGVATFVNLLEDTYLIYEVNLPDGYANTYNTLHSAASFTVTSSKISNTDDFAITIALPSGVDTSSLIIQYEENGTTEETTTATVPASEIDTAYLKFTNTQGYTANVEAIKYDPYDPTAILSAEFYVYRYNEKDNGAVVKQYYKEDGATSNNGIAVFTENEADAKTFEASDGNAFTIANLPVGVYYLEEFDVPSGYETPSSDFEFEITKAMIDEYREENETASTVVFERKIPNFVKTGSVTIKKKNNEDDLLSGVYFLLEVKTEDGYTPIYYNKETWLWEEITDGSTYSAVTDEYGQIIFEALPEGDYRLVEVKTSSNDYALMAEPIDFTIPYVLEVDANTDPATLTQGYDKYELHQMGSDGLYYDHYYYYNLTFTVTNLNVWGLPEAGEFNGSLRIALFLGLTCMLAAVVLYVARRRRRIKHYSRE